MYLKRLEITGFKSFAAHATFLFDQGLTAIVGPNGSGKSNVTDALRWVFGEQRQSLLRGKKADDVIFAGSDKKTRLGLAEVTAVFDNNDRKMPLDAPEVALTRRVNRSGNSEYLINGAQVKLQDLAELVLQSGIGSSQAAVIGQGTVEHLVSGGPVELKSLFDEASGVKMYYIRRNKAWRRLEQTKENLVRAEDRLKEIEPRLKLLRRQVEKYNQREQIAKNLREYQTQWFSLKVHGHLVHLRALELVMEKEKTRELELAEKIQELKSQVLQAHLELEALEKRRETLRGEENNLKEERHRLLEKKAVIGSRLEFTSLQNQDGMANLAAHLSTLKAKQGDIKLKIAQEDEKIARYSKNINELNQSLTGTREKLKTFIEVGAPDTAAFQEIVRQIDGISEILTAFEAKSLLIGDIEEIHKTIRDFVNEFQSFHSRTKKISLPFIGNGLESENEIKDLQITAADFNTQMSDLGNLLQKTRSFREWLTTELKETNGQLERLELGTPSEKTNSTNLSQDIANIEKQIVAIESGLQNRKNEMALTYQEDLALKTRGRIAEQALFDRQNENESLRNSSTLTLMEKTRLDTLLDQIKTEAILSLGEDEWNIIRANLFENAPKSNVDENLLQKQIFTLRGHLESIGATDELTVQEHKETEDSYGSLKTQVNDLTKSEQDLRVAVKELDDKINTTFKEGFVKIDEKFKEYFKLLFGGGKAELSIIYEDIPNPEDETETPTNKGKTPTGIDIKATPPGKRLAAVHSLSGGERALAAIALLCAMIACFPAPIIVLDEADAALDEANTVRFGQILYSLSQKTQFITVTHNRETMIKADTLYGVTMGSDSVSKVLSIKMDQATVYAK